MFHIRMSFLRAVWVLAILTTVLISVPSASGGSEVPFEASFTTEFSAAINFPIANISVNGEGQARYLGRAEASTTNQQANLITGSVTATYTLKAPNGDTVVFEMVAESVFTTPTHVVFEGDYTIVGGTGRFSGASGSGSLEGNATFTSPAGGVGEFAVSGTISAPGRRN